jgi:hypothetical protein
VHNHLLSDTGYGWPDRVLTEQQKLKTIKGKHLEPVVAGNPAIRENRTLGLVSGLFRNKENERLVGAGRQRINYRLYAIAGLAGAAST